MSLLSTTISVQGLWHSLKSSESPAAQRLVFAIKRCRVLEIPAPKWLFSVLYRIWWFANTTLSMVLRTFFWTPMFKSRCSQVGKRLFLYGGMPYIAGPIDITIGDDCRISGRITVTGRGAATTKPTLKIGNNVGIGWQITMAVGTQIRLEDNVRVAGQCFLAGYPGHPVNAQDRALHKADLDSQAKDIVLEKDVWIGTGSTILAGVRIGAGTIVSAGSVVCKDLPPGVIAGGNPAEIIKKIEA